MRNKPNIRTTEVSDPQFDKQPPTATCLDISSDSISEMEDLSKTSSLDTICFQKTPSQGRRLKRLASLSSVITVSLNFIVSFGSDNPLLFRSNLYLHTLDFPF